MSQRLRAIGTQNLPAVPVEFDYIVPGKGANANFLFSSRQIYRLPYINLP